MPGARCDMCGGLLSEPETPHTRENCELCGRATFNLPGPDGLRVGPSEAVVIPAGAIQLSLDVGQSTGQFTYDGLSWFVQQLVGNDAADDPEQIPHSLRLTRENADAVLQQSELLNDFDLESEDQVEAVIERLKEHHGSVAWFAFLKGAFAAIAEEGVDNGDAAKAAWGAQQSMLAHAALVFERDLKDVIWHGYGKVGADQLGEALELWEQNKTNDDEEFWQQAITERPYLLEQLSATPFVIQEGKAYVGGKRVDNTGGGVADFLLRQAVLGSVALLEIKTPVKPLLRVKQYRDGVYAPSEELGGGITQVVGYRQSLLTELYTLSKGKPLEAFNPHCVLLIGQVEGELADDARRRSFELFRRGLGDVDVVTYDELFARVRALRDVLAGTSAASGAG